MDQKVIVNEKTQSPLILTCAASKNPFFRSLVNACLDHGADPKATNNTGNTVLHYAFYYQDLPNAQKLINLDKNLLLAKNLNANSPIDTALKFDNYRIVKQLIENGDLPINFTLKNGDSLGFRIISDALDPINEVPYFTHPDDLSTQKRELKALTDVILLKTDWDLKNSRGETLLSVAINRIINQEDQFIQLVSLGAPIPNDENAKTMIDKCCKKILYFAQHLTSGIKLEELNFIKQVAFHHLIPPNIPTFNALLQEPILGNIIRESYDLNEWFSEMTTLYEKIAKFQMIDNDFEHQRILNTEMMSVIKSINNEKFKAIQEKYNYLAPLFASFNAECTKVTEKIEAFEQRYVLAKEWIENFEKSAPHSLSIREENLENPPPSKYNLEDVIQLCINEKKYSLLPFVMGELSLNVTKETGVYKPLFHFLLDKTFKEAEQYRGGTIADHAIILAQALNEYLLQDEKSITPEEAQLIKTVLPPLIQSLGFCAHWAERKSSEKDLEIFSHEIVKFINDPKTNSPILIPTGCLDHGVSIGVEVSPDRKTASLIVYNTGRGLLKHARLERTNRYQTAFKIHDIPIVDLSQANLWKAVLNATKEKSIEPLYQIIHRLGKNGKIAEPSKNPFDYEQKQMEGTCSAQVSMAFVRHQVLKQIPGSELEKMGLYKILKARTIIQITNPRLSKVTGKIQGASTRKLSKLAADLKLFEDMKKEQSYEQHKTTLFEILKQMGEQSFLKGLETYTPTTDVEKYALLRLCHSQIATHFLMHPEKLHLTANNTPFLDLSIQMFQDRKILRDAFLDDFKKEQSPDMLNRLIFSLPTAIQISAFDWIAAEDANDPEHKLIKNIFEFLPKSSFENFKETLEKLDYPDLLRSATEIEQKKKAEVKQAEQTKIPEYD